MSDFLYTPTKAIQKFRINFIRLWVNYSSDSPFDIKSLNLSSEITLYKILCEARQVRRLERNVGVSTEALALIVRFWLTVTPPLPNDAQAAAQVKGRERYDGFIETLGRRLQKRKSLFQESPEDLQREIESPLIVEPNDDI